MRILKYYFSLLYVVFFSNYMFAQQNELNFIENKNQWQDFIKYKANIAGGAVFFTEDKIVYNFFDVKRVNELHEKEHEAKFKNFKIKDEKVNMHSMSVSILNSNASVIKGNEKLNQYENYFIGNDNKKWAGNVPLYKTISYENIYNNIDLIYYAKESNLKYDFVLRKGANVENIKLKYEGIKPELLNNGNLYFKSSVNEFTEFAPYAYQIIEGKQIEVPCKFVLNNNILSYKILSNYNKEKELIIDPLLVFKTYSGSTAMTFGWSATYDAMGRLYAGGECFGVGWPVTIGAFQTTFGGNIDASINVYTPNGSSLIYSTYFGGTDSDFPNSLIVNSNNELYIFGTTASTNLATTAGTISTTYGGGWQDMFLTRFNSTGSSLIASTYLGGSDADGIQRQIINLDNNENVLIASLTISPNLPVTPGAFQSTLSAGGMNDGVFGCIQPNLANINFLSYLGSTGDEQCNDILQDASNNYILCGMTSSTTFPTTVGSYHPSFMGGTNDGFVCKFDNTGNNLLASSFIGTTDDESVYNLQLDFNNNIYVMGASMNWGSPSTYPISAGVYNNASGNLFIDKLNNTLSSSILSTRIGDMNSTLTPSAFLVDNCDNIYAGCFGANSGLPLTANAIQSTASSLWLFELSPNMGSLMFATYMGEVGDHIDGGSSRFDPNGIIYHSVCTGGSAGYAGFPGAFAPIKLASGWDVSSFKIDFESVGVNTNISVVNNEDTICAPDTVVFVNNSNAASYMWYFGDGDTSTLISPSHYYATPGIYNVMLIGSTLGSCNGTDTSYLTIYALQKPTLIPMLDTITCVNSSVQLNCIATPTGSYNYNWQPGFYLSSNSSPNPTVINPALNTTYTVTVGMPGFQSCTVKDTVTVLSVNGFDVAPKISDICFGDTVQINGSGHSAYTYNWTGGSTVLSPNNLSTAIVAQNIGSNQYLITASYPNCPDSILTVSINTQPMPSIVLEPNYTICANDTLLLTPIVTPSFAYTYDWNPNTDLTSSNTINTKFYGDNSTQITFTVGSIANCTASQIVNIDVIKESTVFSHSDTVICKYDTITLATNVTNFTIVPNYNLNIASDSSSITFYPTVATVYTISTNEKCITNNLYEYAVGVSDNPVANFTITPELPNANNLVIYFNNASQFAQSYIWEMDNAVVSNNVNYSMNYPGEKEVCVTLTATNAIGCWDTITKCKKIGGQNNFFIPNSFSPNKDGMNDKFKLFSRYGMEYEMMIYNRYGELVKSLSADEDFWDGTFKNKDCETGVYYYFVKYKDQYGNEESLKGDINLIR